MSMPVVISWRGLKRVWSLPGQGPISMTIPVSGRAARPDFSGDQPFTFWK